VKISAGKGRKSDKGYCQLYRYKFNATKIRDNNCSIISDDGKTSWAIFTQRDAGQFTG